MYLIYDFKTGYLHAALPHNVVTPWGMMTEYVPGRMLGNYNSAGEAAEAWEGCTLRMVNFPS